MNTYYVHRINRQGEWSFGLSSRLQNRPDYLILSWKKQKNIPLWRFLSRWAFFLNSDSGSGPFYLVVSGHSQRVWSFTDFMFSSQIGSSPADLCFVNSAVILVGLHSIPTCDDHIDHYVPISTCRDVVEMKIKPRGTSTNRLKQRTISMGCPGVLRSLSRKRLQN